MGWGVGTPADGGARGRGEGCLQGSSVRLTFPVRSTSQRHGFSAFSPSLPVPPRGYFKAPSLCWHVQLRVQLTRLFRALGITHPEKEADHGELVMAS